MSLPLIRARAQEFADEVLGRQVVLLCDIAEAAADVGSWLDNAGNWQHDDQDFLATAGALRAALARLENTE